MWAKLKLHNVLILDLQICRKFTTKVDALWCTISHLKSLYVKSVPMLRVLTFAAVAVFSLSMLSCASPCRKMQRTNAKLISGKETYGKKTGKWKRKQHY